MVLQLRYGIPSSGWLMPLEPSSCCENSKQSTKETPAEHRVALPFYGDCSSDSAAAVLVLLLHASIRDY